MRETRSNIWKYIKFRLRELFVRSEYDIVEFIVGLSAVMWGIWVGNPFWDAFLVAPHPHFLEIAPEWFWGTMVGVVGGAQVAAVTIDTYKIRKLVAFVSLCTWIFILCTFGAQRILGPATSLYFVITFTQAWVYLRFVQRVYISNALAHQEGIAHYPDAAD